MKGKGNISLCISKSYGDKQIFKDFSLGIEQGEILAVLGASGCGKTTLLNVLAGLIPYEGEVKNAPSSVGYIFQEPRLLPNLSVAENLRYVGGRCEVIEDILHKMELSSVKNKRPKELSGGEKRRVAIARAFLADAPLFLLDEPFSSLDTGLKVRLGKAFVDLWREKRQTVVFVTHDVEEACMLAHRVVVIKEGRVAFDGRMPDGDLPRAYGSLPTEKGALLETLTD